MSSQDGKSPEDSAFAALRRSLETHQELVRDLALTVNGRENLGILGVRQRMAALELSVNVMGEQQEKLQQAYKERQTNQKRREKYIIASVAGLFAILSTVVGVLLQAGLGS